MAKLTAAEIVEMEKMGERGTDFSVIAGIFRVTETAVRYHLNKDYQNNLKKQVKSRSKDLYANDKDFRQKKKDLHKKFLKRYKIPRNERYPTIFDVFLELESPEAALSPIELLGKYGSSYQNVVRSLRNYSIKGFLIKEKRGKYKLNNERLSDIKEFSNAAGQKSNKILL